MDYSLDRIDRRRYYIVLIIAWYGNLVQDLFVLELQVQDVPGGRYDPGAVIDAPAHYPDDVLR